MHKDTTSSDTGVRLYSQTPYDDRGNFFYDGDLYHQSESLISTVERVEQHLRVQFPDARFAFQTERYTGGRKITAELLDTSEDLTSREAQQDFTVRVLDQIRRFGFNRANIYQDYHACAFFSQVRIGEAYWAALAKRQGVQNPVDTVVSLAAFRKQLKPGDRMVRIDAPDAPHTPEAIRIVQAVRSKDIVFDGPRYLQLPRATQFACDGKYVRIAIGSESQPDHHLLYEWQRQAA
jgi:hypothetical protein